MRCSVDSQEFQLRANQLVTQVRKIGRLAQTDTSRGVALHHIEPQHGRFLDMQLSKSPEILTYPQRILGLLTPRPDGV